MLLYAMGNMSQGMIARLFDVSEVAVFKWIRKEAAALPEPTIPADVEIVQQGAIWHFVDGNNVGSEKPSIRSTAEPLSRRGILGYGDAATCKQRLAKVGVEDRAFLTDDWEGCHRCIPDCQIFTGP